MKTSVGIFLVLSTALLFGAHIGATYAGGAGYTPPLTVFTQETIGSVFEDDAGNSIPVSSTPPRGSTITTLPGASALFDIAGTWIGLYENTTVTFNKLTPTRIEIAVPKGRIAVYSHTSNHRRVQISSAKVDALSIDGEMSFVNYDFEQRVSVIPISGSVGIVVNNNDAQITQTPVDISEKAPFAVTDTKFSLDGNSAKDFYTWFDDRVKAQTTDGTSG